MFKVIPTPHGRMAKLLTQDTTIRDLPDKCVGHDIHLTVQKTNIIILGEVPTIISAWDSDMVSNRILQTQHVCKRKFATQFDEMTLRDSREMNYGSKL